jgi:polyisoprenoid-binding protein YceI
MEEHFNENYVESDKFPKTTFAGKITNLSDVNFSKDGKYPVQVTGVLEIHGVKKNVEANGTITIKGSTLSADAKFKVLLSDYNIIIPTAVKGTINNSIEITVDADYSKAP